MRVVPWEWIRVSWFVGVGSWALVLWALICGSWIVRVGGSRPGVEWKSDTSARGMLHNHLIGYSCDISQEREVLSDLEELTRASIGWVEIW